MNWKKWIAMVLAIVCTLSLTACGGEDTKTTDAPKETVVENQNDIFEQIEDVAQNNAQAEVGKYVLVTEADLNWEDVENGVAITGYTGTHTAVEIPAQVGGKDVVEIRGGAFSSNIVVGVKLPDTVVTVGENAFYYVTTLVELKMGAGVKTLATGAMEGCIALTNVELNVGLEEIGERAFSMCTSLKSIDIPDSVNHIGKAAFVLSGLESIVIPGSVQVIGVQAFSNCSSLKKAVIEDGVTMIDECAFEVCEMMEYVEIPASATEFGYAPFLRCEKLVIHAPAGSAAEAYANENGIAFKSK